MDLLLAIKSEAFAVALSASLPQYNVHICHTGTDALTFLETLRSDVLILDLCLPVKDGLSVLRETRYKPPVILALTNLVTDKVLQDAVGAGAQDVLLVPCTLRYVLAHLDALIEKAPSLEA